MTVSLDLPFAQNRFCGAESIKNMRSASDYQDRNFGKSYGTLIEELKILSRAVFVLDKDGKVVYAEYVPEVASEPNYDAGAGGVEVAAVVQQCNHEGTRHDEDDEGTLIAQSLIDCDSCSNCRSRRAFVG